MKKVRIFAPATVANVSCGFDILGFPLSNVGDEMVIRKREEKGVRITKIEGAEGLPLEAEKNVSGVVALKMLEKLGIDQGVEIEIYKGIKAGSGIGSSAASSAGVAYGINQLFAEPFSTQQLVEFAMEGERLASGVAHADNVAPAISGGFTLVRSYHPLDVIAIPSPDDLYCTVIHPQIEVRTADSRNILKEKVPLKDAVQQWGNVAGLVAGLIKNDYDLIGRSLEDVIIEPIRSILIPGFDKVKKLSVEAGALGCGISGSGPSIFALSRGKETATRIKEAMNQAYKELGIDFELHLSKICASGVRTLPENI
ncbi:homoserine kinase [Cytophagales bacterium RKSG123]|nr:homoserine kinase [Xanthovirga aplysinae]MTI32641.1 homoserine kinase [Xanthovirga aplysinae]